LARGKLAMGLAVVGGMLAGVILTICSFAVAAIFARPSWCCRCWAVATRSSEVSSTIEPHRRLTAYAWVVDGAVWRPRRAGTRSRYAHEDLDSAPEKDLTLPRASKNRPQWAEIQCGKAMDTR
jgi:hypothetical protein